MGPAVVPSVCWNCGGHQWKEDSTALRHCAKCGSAPYPATAESLNNDDANPKDIVGRSKPCPFYFPPSALIQMSRVMELGAAKYGQYNFRDKKVSWSAYYSAAMRHLCAALDGEKADPESGMPHEAHAGACMAILLDAMATGNIIDDRPKPGVTAELIKQMTIKPT